MSSASSAARRRGVLRGPLPLVLVWVVTRLLGFMQWWGTPQHPLGDVSHYWSSLSEHPLRDALPEYPVPVAWLMTPMRLVSGASQYRFGLCFGAAMTVADVIAIVLLWRRGSLIGAWYWTVFGASLGCQLLWFRFDVLTATLVMAALLVRRRRPALAGGLVAAGAALKLWPVLLVAAMWRRGRAGRRFLAGLVGTGLAVVLVACMTSGWGRLVSPLRWQQDRGLHIESVVATPLMVLRAHHPRRWRTSMSTYGAYELSGPHVGEALTVANGLNLVLVVLALVLFVRSWGVEPPRTLHETRVDDARMAVGSAALIAAFMVANKTFSPQYLYWLMAPVLVVVLHRRDAGRGRAGVLAVLVLASAALTRWFYVSHYGPLHRLEPGAVYWTTVLAVRNLLVVLTAALAVLWSWRRPPAADAAGPQPQPAAGVARPRSTDHR